MSPFTGHAVLDRRQLSRFTGRLTPVPLQLLSVPADPARLYVAPGPVAATMDMGNDGTDVFIGGRLRTALSSTRQWADWDRFDG